MREDVPTVSLPTWMNSDHVRKVGVKPNPAGCLGSMSLIKNLFKVHAHNSPRDNLQSSSNSYDSSIAGSMLHVNSYFSTIID